MTATTFSQTTKRLGIHKPYCGPDAVRALSSLRDAALIARTNRGYERSLAPSNMPQMGKLIRAGLAAFHPESKTYTATAEGLAWLDQLKSHNLI